MKKFLNAFRSGRQKNDDLVEGFEGFEVKPPAGLPILPRRRQGLLTPSPSRPNLSVKCPASDLFFGWLPIELRDQIYIAAFGERTVHMDLLYRENSGPLRVPPRKRFVWSSKPPTVAVSPCWEWWSCVCHRQPLFQRGTPLCRATYDDSRRRGCSLGVMGWLLACRQA